MRHSYSVPQDNGSRQSTQCPSSLPPFDGVAVPSCACIRADCTTIRAIDALTGVNEKSLPSVKSPGEHEIFSSCLTIDGGGILSDGCTSDAVGPSGSVQPLGTRVDGTLACLPGSAKAIVLPSSYEKNGGGILSDGRTSDAVDPSETT
jgi:hypothetical protein